MSVREKLGAERYTGAIDFTIESRSADKVLARMAVTDDMLNPFGTVHAGAMIWFADIAATVCAMGDLDSVAEDGRGFPLAIDLHTVLIGNVRSGEITAESRPVRRGRKVTVIRTEVTGPDGKLLIDVTTTHVPAG